MKITSNTFHYYPLHICIIGCRVNTWGLKTKALRCNYFNSSTRSHKFTDGFQGTMSCFKTRRMSLKQRHKDYTTVKPLFSSHAGKRAKRPLYRGWPLKQVFQKVVYGRRRRPPSISKDDGCTLLSHVRVLHFLWWLYSLILEWESLEQVGQMKGDAVVSCVDLALRSALFCCSVVVRSSSALSTPLRTADLHAPRFSARLSHVSKSIPTPFKSRLHESLYLRVGRPRDLAPFASSQ